MKRTAKLLESDKAASISSQQVLEATCRDVAEATGANRVSIWDFSQDRENIRCACFFEAPEDRFTSGQVLTASELPTYFETILKEKQIVATEARYHSATAEFLAPLLPRPRHLFSARLRHPRQFQTDRCDLLRECR